MRFNYSLAASIEPVCVPYWMWFSKTRQLRRRRLDSLLAVKLLSVSIQSRVSRQLKKSQLASLESRYWQPAAQECSLQSVRVLSFLLTHVDVRYDRGRPHIWASGVSWPPWKNGWKIKKRKRATESSFLCLCYILRAIRAGRCRERRYADHIFIQIYFIMHHFVVKFSKFSCLWRQGGGHWPP